MELLSNNRTAIVTITWKLQFWPKQYVQYLKRYFNGIHRIMDKNHQIFITFQTETVNAEQWWCANLTRRILGRHALVTVTCHVTKLSVTISWRFLSPALPTFILTHISLESNRSVLTTRKVGHLGMDASDPQMLLCSRPLIDSPYCRRTSLSSWANRDESVFSEDFSALRVSRLPSLCMSDEGSDSPRCPLWQGVCRWVEGSEWLWTEMSLIDRSLQRVYRSRNGLVSNMRRGPMRVIFCSIDVVYLHVFRDVLYPGRRPESRDSSLS